MNKISSSCISRSSHVSSSRYVMFKFTFRQSWYSHETRICFKFMLCYVHIYVMFQVHIYVMSCSSSCSNYACSRSCYVLSPCYISSSRSCYVSSHVHAKLQFQFKLCQLCYVVCQVMLWLLMIWLCIHAFTAMHASLTCVEVFR